MTTDSAARPPLDKARLDRGQPRARCPTCRRGARRASRRPTPLAAERARAGRPRRPRRRGRPPDRRPRPPRPHLGDAGRHRGHVLDAAAPDRPDPRVAVAPAAHRVRRRQGHQGRRARRRGEVAQRRADRRQKVAGILVERIETPDGPAAVVGVGINVVADRRRAAGARPRPRSSVELGRAVDRTDVLVEVLSAIREAYDAWEAGATQRHAPGRVLRRRLRHRRPQVRVDLPGGDVLEGTGDRHRPDGPAGRRGRRAPRAVAAGDVVHVEARRSDMIAAWPSPRSCSTPARRSSSARARTPRR